MQIIGRTDADPDYVPRSGDFGLNVAVFRDKYGSDCPSPFFDVAVTCCNITPDERSVILSNYQSLFHEVTFFHSV